MNQSALGGMKPALKQKFMSHLYVTCELGVEKGRIVLGALQKEGLSVSDAGTFQDVLTVQDGVAQWDIPRIYQQVLSGARGIVAQEEPVRGISFYSSVTDALLFEANGTMLGPATRPAAEAGTMALNKLLAEIPFPELYEETGTQASPTSPLCQLAGESSRRLKKASHALNLADAFNHLLSGVARVEVSQACQTQLYNPTRKEWSQRLLKAAGIPEKLLPPLVQPGTVLGQTRADIVQNTGLQDARVIATCSHELAAALAALSIADGDNWAFLWPGYDTRIGTVIGSPFINDFSREMQYSNLSGYADSVVFYKEWVGLRLVEECRRSWVQQDRALDQEVLMHLATSAPPFESLIDPGDPRFSTSNDMPQAIQSFCRQTGQEPPRKPGPILRCVLESLALQYRKALLELDYVTSANFSKLYVLGGQSNPLLNHFLTNALQLPVVVVAADAAAVGNVALQALALGHISSLEEARPLVKSCLRGHTINPHATAWTKAYERFLEIKPV
jgi:rhamnulokinase